MKSRHKSPKSCGIRGKNCWVYVPYNLWTSVKSNIPDVWNFWISIGSKIEGCGGITPSYTIGYASVQDANYSSVRVDLVITWIIIEVIKGDLRLLMLKLNNVRFAVYFSVIKWDAPKYSPDLTFSWCSVLP